jgi:predicted GNAT family acetyltransferase
MLPAVTTPSSPAEPPPSAADVRDNRDQEQYEIWVDGERAGLVAYIRGDDVIELVHTEVDERFQGQGVAGKLVGAVLDDARAAGLAVRPDCPYVRSWIRRHEDYRDLVRPADRPRYDL